MGVEAEQGSRWRVRLVRGCAVVWLAFSTVIYLPLVLAYWPYLPGSGANWAWVRATAWLALPFLVGLGVLSLHSSRRWLIGSVAATVTASSIVGGVWLWNRAALSTDRLRSRIDVVVPSGWELEESHENEGAGCLDVCPTVGRTYRSDLSADASLAAIARELEQHGFDMAPMDPEDLIVDLDATGAARGTVSHASVDVGVAPDRAGGSRVHIEMEGRD